MIMKHILVLLDLCIVHNNFVKRINVRDAHYHVSRLCRYGNFIVPCLFVMYKYSYFVTIYRYSVQYFCIIHNHTWLCVLVYVCNFLTISVYVYVIITYYILYYPSVLRLRTAPIIVDNIQTNVYASHVTP